MEQPTADQVRRWEADHTYAYERPCFRCGNPRFGTCQCLTSQARRVGDAIEALGPECRKQILEGTQVKTLEQQAKELVDKANEMLKAAEKLQAKATSMRYVYPERPQFKRGTIDIRFRGQSKTYTYLLLFLEDGRIYTTGTGESATFLSWKAFVDWLRSDDVQQCSKLYPLSMNSIGMTVVPNER